MSKDRATLEDQVVRQAQEQLGLKTLRPSRPWWKNAQPLPVPQGLRRPGNRVLRPVGRRRLTRKAPTQPRWKALSAAACTQRSKSQACATENDPFGGQILARSQAVQPTRATLIRIKIVDLDTERGPLRERVRRFISNYLLQNDKIGINAFFAYPAVSHPNGVRSFPCQPPRPPCGPSPRACDKALPQTSLFSPHPFTVRMHPMKSSGCTGR